MREIKFRAWDNQENKIITNGCLGAGSSAQLIVIEWQGGLTLANAYGLYDGTNPTFDKPVTERFILMQYTGLKDKNGKDIYEGDILEFDPEDDEPNPPYHVQVIWEKEDAKFYCEEVIGNRYGGYMSEFEDSIVIGNIYENPELLEPNGRKS